MYLTLTFVYNNVNIIVYFRKNEEQREDIEQNPSTNNIDIRGEHFSENSNSSESERIIKNSSLQVKIKTIIVLQKVKRIMKNLLLQMKIVLQKMKIMKKSLLGKNMREIMNHYTVVPHLLLMKACF